MDRNGKRLQRVVDFLESETTLALATADKHGSVYVTPLFYLPREGARLFWFSSATSRHSRNLRENPRVAGTVYSPTGDWKQIRGLQMRGSASHVSDSGAPGDRERVYGTVSPRHSLRGSHLEEHVILLPTRMGALYR
jgi:uncharacterized protein YhbP (UPF0306 family)